jgi:hypothetical protein
VKQLKIVRVCVSFGPIGSMPTIGMASVGSLHESDSTPLKGIQNEKLCPPRTTGLAFQGAANFTRGSSIAIVMI